MKMHSGLAVFSSLALLACTEQAPTTDPAEAEMVILQEPAADFAGQMQQLAQDYFALRPETATYYGVPDEKAGEIVKAFVVLDPGKRGRTGAEDILRHVRGEADRGVGLSTIGFGMGNFNDVLMEKLADQGDGNYYYVDELREAVRGYTVEASADGYLAALGLGSPA